ncbi:MAG: hypothetical protein ACTIA5_01530 [Brachybacterium tyrofermentans]
MTTLYRPVLIETAEQAEALPDGTLARHSEGAGMDHAHKVRALGLQVWIGDRTNYYNAHMVGWTALVPIEAERIRAENRGGFFVVERHAMEPFAAYYVDEELA